MLYENIAEEAERIVKKYNERNPFRLCRDMDIIMLFRSMGSGEGAIKGFYFEACRIETITVNSDLPESVQKIIAAHELGHALLHKTDGVRLFHETGLLDGRRIRKRIFSPPSFCYRTVRFWRCLIKAEAFFQPPPSLMFPPSFWTLSSE